MEELQSTEILEREILEDARKKALRILKDADETSALKIAEWEKRTKANFESIHLKYAKVKEQAKEKITSRIPIDKLRAKAQKTESLLKEAADSWYKNQSKKRITELLKNELTKKLEICRKISSSEIKVFYCNMEKDDVLAVLKNINLIKFDDNINIEKIDNTNTADIYPEIIIDTEDMRITVSIQQIMDHLLDVKRYELTNALTGQVPCRDM